MTDASITWETNPGLIPDDEYVTISPEGHLQLEGERVRYWGHIGHFPNARPDSPDSKRELELMVQRMVDVGFNMHRLWRHADEPYTKDDGSRGDNVDYGIYLMKKNNIRVWFGELNDLGMVLEEDVGVVDDPATADAWKAAVKAEYRTFWWSEGKEGMHLNCNLVRRWDPRVQALALRRMEAVAKHVNQWTGMRLCDDPNIAIWELNNEEWWMSRMVAGEWMKLPEFFRTSLLLKWNAWLKDTYGDDTGLRRAWSFLLDHESLAEGTVMLQPLRGNTGPVTLNDENPHAVASMQSVGQTYGRDDFTAARASDVLEFFMQLWVKSKETEAAAVRSYGKSTRLCPLLYDTGIGSQIQSEYLHQLAGAVTQCTYINGKHHDPTHKRFPFNSGLEELPRLCYDTPWVEQNRAPDMPFFVYEIQIKTSTKYRAEFPMRVASLGAIQDWDVVNWHTYGPGPDVSSETPHTRALEVGHSMDLHFGGDEVQISAMKAASEIFRGGLLKTPDTPTYFIYGKKALYDPGSMDYSGSYFGMMGQMLATTYRHGMRLVVDPTLDDRPEHEYFRGEGGAPDPKKYEAFVRSGCMTIGPVVKPRVFEASPITPTDQISYNWRRGYLKFDAPGVAMYTGFYADCEDPADGVRFAESGARLSQVRVTNPPGMPYPVADDEQYVAFALTSCDGKALRETANAVISLVSTSFNTGYELDLDGSLAEFQGAQVKTPGDLPVLVARVSASVECDAIDGMSYTFYDWEMNELEKGAVSGGALAVPADRPVFFVALSR